MTDNQKLKKAYEDIVWMAIRYADGRHTYAPSMVRDSLKLFKEVFPEFELKEDITIKEPDKPYSAWTFPSDYLHDLFNVK